MTGPAARPRVGIVLPHRESFGPDGAGAVASVVHRLATGGSRYQALVLGPPVRGAPFADAAFLPVGRARWLPLTPTRSYALMLAASLRRLPPAMQIEVHNKPDVAAMLARLFPARQVSLFLHNDPRSMRGARTPRERGRLLDRLASVCVVSDYLRSAMLDGLSERARREPMVLHNAIDMAELPPSLPMAEREPVLLFVGRVVPDKAPDAFAAACARALPSLPGWRARIIGADGFGPGTPETGFIQKLRPACAAAGIEMLGFQGREPVLEAMSRAAVVVVPSRWPEPFGLVALEALACGAALVCSGRGGLAEVAGDCCVRIDPDDIEGFAQALTGLARDAAARVRLSEAGRRRAATQFSLQASIARLDTLRDRMRC